ncbi:type VI secretion system ATPase TssH [Roseospira marina]|uniref:Type VI secretion system ATPase TssH n=1 Tax=Roseospira marina TaxID=140057 RepID=A0A5M6IG95_9PROT|nr:type VI secretion system ATPase TssH [Roseospira marina]KAA5606907.1 type VI secretion system ATPase TssH [Roseospira marina]MBB4312922.1 type VI secretion system protein VasG [Roseospira marina]MBB5086305.1 type VI secretion system protein VasG [Roseospira marina]
MSAVDLNALLSKLHPQARRALEEAVAIAVSRSHFNVEIEHWLQRMLDDANGDVQTILRQFDVDVGAVSTALNRVVDGLKTGNARTPGLSPQIIEAAREAWNIASLRFGAPQVRTGHVLLAVLERDTLSATVLNSVPPLKGVSLEALTNTLPEVCAGSSEDQQGSAANLGGGVGGEGGGSSGPVPKGGALDQFTIDLTQRARDGAIDPVLGRDQEIRQIIDILTRRRQNNPILTGEAGVGKTAVVEGFALRVAAGDVPPSIKPVVVRTLDLGLLQAGAGMRGEFENRLKSVIEEVRASTQPIILFIDEAHTLIGAGGSAGQGDAANLLKPALARGELRTIAATTWAEYKKYFERDAALARRFQVVKVEEPNEVVAVQMMRGLVDTLEQHHGVRILDEAVVESVRLSHRYISGRQLPDKSVSLLDTACARVSLSQHATPSQVEDLRRRIESLDTAIRIAEREAQVEKARQVDADDMRATRDACAADLAALDARWQQELDLVGEIRDLRGRLEAAHGTDRATAGSGSPPEAEGAVLPSDARTPAAPTEEDVAGLRSEIEEKSVALAALQGEDPLLQAVVDGQAVAAVVGAWTGIPVGRMVSNEINTILNLQTEMGKRILGQDTALEVVSEAVMSGRARLSDPRKPLAVFMLVGTSGVGKTETALTLAELLYGGEQNMTIINMSEFKEEHKVSLLMGSPPGYVGYGEGGVLTEAVRRKPYSVVLLDEMEKAHPGVQDIFYQVFDKGMLKDGEGRDIDFKNTVIIMTSNAGTDTIHALCDDPETMPDSDGLYDALRPELLKVFKPAFLGRVTVVPYFPLPTEIIKGIVRLQIGRVKDRVRDAYKAELDVDEAVIDLIATRATEVESGARVIDRILTRNVLPDLAARILTRMANGEPVTRASLRAGEGDSILCAVEA